MKKAFTLIEVMVVLSILAIIAILAYNFFGGTMKDATKTQAATKIYNDLRIIGDAAELYYKDNAAWPANVADMVTDGQIKSEPVPDQKHVGDFGGSLTYAFGAYDDFGGPSASSDYVAYAYPVNEETCVAINDKYGPAALAGTWADYTADGNTYTKNVSMHCIDDYGGAGNDQGSFSVFLVVSHAD